MALTDHSAAWLVMVVASAAWAEQPNVTAAEARALVATSAECAGDEAAAVVECLLTDSLRRDRKAFDLALGLYRSSGVVVGVLHEQDFEGGYRGVIHLVPERPVTDQRHHLEFVVGAFADFEQFFADTERLAEKPIAYRWKNLGFRFFRSVKRRTPAAFANDWTVSYNVNGTLNGSLPVVRGLLFHEVFHLNDDGWSVRELSEDYDAIVQRCGTGIDCLTRYVPEPLLVKVKGGTYYSFMPGNGVGEYAADLALRYFKEQREVMAGRAVKAPFKCGAPENARAWSKLKDRFFAGVDRVPSCFER